MNGDKKGRAFVYDQGRFLRLAGLLQESTLKIAVAFGRCNDYIRPSG